MSVECYREVWAGDINVRINSMIVALTKEKGVPRLSLSLEVRKIRWK